MIVGAGVGQADSVSLLNQAVFSAESNLKTVALLGGAILLLIAFLGRRSQR